MFNTKNEETEKRNYLKKLTEKFSEKLEDRKSTYKVKLVTGESSFENRPDSFPDIPVENAEKITGMHYSGTGLSLYRFSRGNKEICTISEPPLPDNPVFISGFGRKWTSKFNDEITINPWEERRLVIDDSSGSLVGWISFRDPGEHEINDSIRLIFREGRYTAYSGKELVGQIIMIKNKDEDTFIDDGMDGVLRYEIYVCRGLDEELLMLLLAFPLLRFGPDYDPGEY
ncbi:MAG: hypothetical protein IJ137_05945 [Eubacterium sp.]|nr:hypothetical protein [Eubacterium sp.]